MSTAPPHPEQLAFLSGIIAHPADDIRRLVYADWLDEHGRPEMADFIRVQVEIAALCEKTRAGTVTAEESARHLGLFDREMELIRTTGVYEETVHVTARWLRSVGIDYSHCVFNRGGFLHTVQCRMADWVGGECGHCQGRGELWNGGWENRTTPIVQPDEMRVCLVCNGDRTRPGVGPQLVATHPVEKVVLTDREPWHNDRGSNPDPDVREELLLPDVWVWLKEHVTDGPPNRHRLPAVVWEFLQPDPRRTTAGFDTPDSALDALSAALLAWASANAPPKTPPRKSPVYPPPPREFP